MSLALLGAIALITGPAAAVVHPPPQLDDYRLFRALSIDLLGRAPSRAELADFDTPSFDLDTWIDAHTSGPAYAERLRRVYLDALRLEINPKFPYTPAVSMLRRQTVLGPDGRPINVYFRQGQRRQDPLTDGDFCLPAAITGLVMKPRLPGEGTARPVPQAALDERTVLVEPWWLYADYREPRPHDRYDASFARRFGFVLTPELLLEPDKSPTTAVRVCKEEAQTADQGIVMVRSGTPPAARTWPAPVDGRYATVHAGQAISCMTGTGFAVSAGCGCGVGLERCWPVTSHTLEAPAFMAPAQAPLGLAAPLAVGRTLAAGWIRLWWEQEAVHFLDMLVLEDRDFREVLTSRATVVNGPLVQFYRFMQGASCCYREAEFFDYGAPVPLVDPEAMPTTLLPFATTSWVEIPDRGPLAAGVMTMPAFLIKYATRRARAHVLTNAFLCRDFVASSVKLLPSSEPDLTRRPGCATCHRTLEPMAAYFSRIEESSWTYLPATVFPVHQEACDRTPMPPRCKIWYDPDFGSLRGAHASPEHADLGPPALGKEITGSPAFAPCVVTKVAESFLGRPLDARDDAWKAGLARDFVAGGYRLRGLVRAILRSPEYREIAR
jgi:hypothetical protein